MPRQNNIQIRRGTAAEWSSSNPVLDDGEIGYDKTNNNIKIGDGTKTWSSLSYTTGETGPASEALKLNSLTFNGSTTTFALASGATTVYPASAAALIISLNGVVQEPDVDYSVSGSNITFAQAPTSGTDFFGISLNGIAAPITAASITSGTLDIARIPTGTSSSTVCIGNDARLSDTRTPTDNTVSTAKLQDDAVTYAKLQNVSATDRLLGRSSAGAGNVEEIACGSFGRSLIGSADAASARSTLSVQPTASPAFTGGPSIINSGASDNSTIRYGNASADWYVGLRGDTSNVFAITDASSFRLTISTTGVSTFSGSVVINNDGNVVPLTVTNTGTANSFVVNDESGDTTPFVVDAAGRVVIGATSAFSDAHKFAILGGLPSSSGVTVGFIVRASIPSTTTNNYISYFSNVQTDAASFTLASLEHYAANQQGTFSAGSSVTSQYGFVARSSLTGATNNYGFYSDIASGTGRWNFYANGTAASFFGGQVQISAGSASACGVAFSGDTNTGLAQIGGADTASVVTAGVERVRVDASGNVGIGASPSFKLDVSGVGRIGNGVSQGNPSSTDIKSTAHTLLSGTGGNYLAFGQYGDGANYAQWMQATFDNPSTAKYNIVMQPLGGEVLIGTTTDNGAYLLQVNSQIYATNATIATSDARFKTNVESLNDATAVIEALRPVAFDFIPHAERNFAAERQVGLIAQEAQSALAGTDYAESVVAQCGDHLGLAYEKLVPVLIKALQESNARIAALEERLSNS